MGLNLSHSEVSRFPKVASLLLIVYKLQKPPSRIVELVNPLYSGIFFHIDKRLRIGWSSIYFKGTQVVISKYR